MNIAVGVDGSPESSRALDMAARMVEAFGGHIDVLNARSLDGFGGSSDPGGVPALSETFAALEDQAHAEAAELLDRRGLSWTFGVRLGRPAEVLLNFLHEASVELVVVGRRGTGLTARAPLGSTATELVNLSPVPVLVVP
jgi:nucleotide-binding universal stress UspA family protein